MRYVVLAAASMLVLAGLGAEARTRLLVNCFWPPQHHVCTKVLPAWIADVERVTEGRVSGIIPPKSVAPPPEQLAAVEQGLVDVAVQFNGLIQNRVKGPLVAMQPFVGIDDARIMSIALWETNRRFFPDEFDSVHLLTQFVISPGQLYSLTDEPINSVEELASRKMWVLLGPLAAIAKKLGAGVVSTPAVKAAEIISRGVVDGHLGLDAQAVRAFQLFSYTRSNTKFATPIYTTSFSMFMSKDKWAKISSADREAIMQVSGAVLGAKFGESWNADNFAAEALYPEYGIEVVAADPSFEQALKDASAFVTETWLAEAAAAGIDAEGALAFYRARLAELASRDGRQQ